MMISPLSIKYVTKGNLSTSVGPFTYFLIPPNCTNIKMLDSSSQSWTWDLSMD